MPAVDVPPAAPPFEIEVSAEKPDCYYITGRDEGGAIVVIASGMSHTAAWYIRDMLDRTDRQNEEARVRADAEERALALWRERYDEEDPRADPGCCGQHYVELLTFLLEELDRLKATPAQGLTRNERATLDAGKPVEAMKMIQKRVGLSLAEAKVFLDKFRTPTSW